MSGDGEGFLGDGGGRFRGLVGDIVPRILPKERNAGGDDGLLIAGILVVEGAGAGDGEVVAQDAVVGEHDIGFGATVVGLVGGTDYDGERALGDVGGDGGSIKNGVVVRRAAGERDAFDGDGLLGAGMLVAERSRAVQRSDVVARNCRREGEVGDGLDGAVIDFVLDVDQGGERLAGNRKGGGGVGEGVVGIEAAFRNDGVGTDAGVIAGDGADGRGNNR